MSEEHIRPYQDLCRAILLRAVHDALGPPRISSGQNHKKIKRDAIKWLQINNSCLQEPCQDNDPRFTLQEVCQGIQVDPARVHGAVRFYAAVLKTKNTNHPLGYNHTSLKTSKVCNPPNTHNGSLKVPFETHNYRYLSSILFKDGEFELPRWGESP